MQLPGLIDSHTDQEDNELAVHLGCHAFVDDFLHFCPPGDDMLGG
jgi:hypothetical protein